MSNKLLLFAFTIFLTTVCPVAWGADVVGLVTSVSGHIQLMDGAAPAKNLKAFIKVCNGDRITLNTAARLQMVFFENGSQETWTGKGLIEVQRNSGRKLKGDSKNTVKVLPEILIRQLSKTPAPDGVSKSGMIRLRTITTDVTTLEESETRYAEFRKLSDPDDYTPEAYLLSAYLELKQIDKIVQLLDKLKLQNPTSVAVQNLDIIYRRAIYKK